MSLDIPTLLCYTWCTNGGVRMLIKCPECDLQVSDKAQSCPHCGYPMVPEEKQKRRSRQNRRKRLPNGFGQITEIKGKALRKPFRAMVTVGKTEEGRPICRLLKPEAYFETYNDAYATLVEYNRNPYDFDSDITMDELFKRWSERHFKKLSSQDSAKNIRCAWSHCSAIYQTPVKEIRARHMKSMIEESDATPGTKTLMKMVLNQIMDYAVEYEIVEHNYARDFKIDKVDKSKVTGTGAHNTITDEELDVIWSHSGESIWIDMILIQCYSGWRPIELCRLLKADVDLSIGCFYGGSKTESGRNRQVPIHSRITKLVERYLDNGESEFLFGELTYEQYRYAFHQELERIGLQDHTPHDCRVRFVTKAKECELDEYAIKRIVGHTISDLTERVYTKRDFSWLKSEMEKLR